MAIYTVLLAAGELGPDGGGETIYVAPPEGVIVVRDIVLGSRQGSTPVAAIRAGSGTLYVAVFAVNGLPADTTVHWEGRQVLLPGQELTFFASEGPASYRVTGYHLGVP